MTTLARAPAKWDEQSCGYDLASAYDNTILANESLKIHTDIALQIPNGCYGKFPSRSGPALHNKIDLLAGNLIFMKIKCIT